MSASDEPNRPADSAAPGQAGLSIEQLLDHARRALIRLEPFEAQRTAASGAILVDIRPWEQRVRDGAIPGALVIDRNVLEWRLDPMSEFRHPSVSGDQKVILICNEGYSSSLAAATLRLLGRDATDVIGGFGKWRQDGLPVAP